MTYSVLCSADGWFDDIPRATFKPFAAVIRSIAGRRPNGGDSAEVLEHAFSNLWDAVRPGGSLPWNEAFLKPFYIDEAGTYWQGMPLWFANSADATTGNILDPPPGFALHISANV